MMSQEEVKEFTVQGRDTPVPAAGSEQAGSQASRSNDRSAPRVDLLAPGASNASRDERRPILKPPILLVDDKPLSRSPSLTSLASMASDKSVFSNATARDIRDCQEDREHCIKLRSEEENLIEQVKKQVGEMLKACEKQTNVSMVIKDGLKRVRDWVEMAQAKHAEADETDRKFDQGLQFTEDGRKERRRLREAIQARQIRKVVLECQKTEKKIKGGKRTLSGSGEEGQEKKKKTSQPATFAEKLKSPTKEPSKPKPKGKEQKRAERATPVRPRASTMLIRVSKGQTYASVLGKLRKEVDPVLCQSEVIGARKTQKGDLLLKLGGKSNKEMFTAKVSEVVGEMATVQVPDDQKVTLEIRDLDGLTEKEEVVLALERVLGKARIERMVKLLPENKRGIKLAVITVARREAEILERLGHVKVGFMSCCVRKRVTVTRCHRCLDFGHKAAQCKGVDRSSACFKCGETGHTLANCKNDPRCFLCSAKEDQACDHVAGSGKCAAFRRILEAAKKGRGA